MKFLKLSLFFCTGLFLLIILLVRFTGLIMSVGPIRLDYDEKNKTFLINEKPPLELNGIDGPYIYSDSIVRVNHLSEVYTEPLNINTSIPIWINNSLQPAFNIYLQPPSQKEIFSFSMPNKLIAISDIEGNFNAFSSFLMANHVIDSTYNWIFDNGHLILNGDFVDRGEQVPQVLWLIYKLEYEARHQGGKVHFILGNHEIMNIQGNFFYAKNKYKKLSLLLANKNESTLGYRYLYNKYSVLGKWLRSKPIAIQLGSYIFTHAGLSPKLLYYNLDISELNKISDTYIEQNIYKKNTTDDKVNIVCGKHSPFWYRGLVQDCKYYDKIKPQVLNQLLTSYNAKYICIGHTIVNDVSTDFNGKVIRIDVKHGKNKYSKDTKGIRIENGLLYKINGQGTSIML